MSRLAALLDEDSDNEADFVLKAPDKYAATQRHLYTLVDFSIGGKQPDAFIKGCELSKAHLAKDVVKHVLTQLRKNRALQDLVKFKNDLTDPEGFQLKQVEDDSDDSEQEEAGTPFKPASDLPPLDDDQPINNFTMLVLVERAKYVSKKDDGSRAITFLHRVPYMERITLPDELGSASAINQSNSSSTLNSPTKSPMDQLPQVK